MLTSYRATVRFNRTASEFKRTGTRWGYGAFRQRRNCTRTRIESQMRLNMVPSSQCSMCMRRKQSALSMPSMRELSPQKGGLSPTANQSRNQRDSSGSSGSFTIQTEVNFSSPGVHAPSHSECTGLACGSLATCLLKPVPAGCQS